MIGFTAVHMAVLQGRVNVTSSGQLLRDKVTYSD